MKSIRLLLLLFSSLCILSACSASEDAADLYKKEKPLQVEVDMPESLSAETKQTVKAILKQDGKPVEDARFVHFEIWKQDHSVHYPMEEAEEAENGVYQMDVRFKEEGLYYLEVHAGNEGSLISPVRQFIVGELSEQEMESLKQGVPTQQEVRGHHH
ncbi:hypothetical protein BN1080_00164 [Planococcus massiliensis]|uniref:YtkA-like domain-containing protein n=1 Tax=Planococcus massiliensis TaxID=1499687 RepID=A0A098EG56_9BACL|nr:FixH family protein [Planococcus massiliensis]CEG21258.1 hypothetical protein BN1080_00164 [Planococcus massiliensis]